MTARSNRRRWPASAFSVLAAGLLVAGVTQPVARVGIGSSLSLHALFDLVLAGNLPLDVPRWLGVSGYLPAIGGALLLVAEAFDGPTRVVVRAIGLVVAVVSVLAIVVFGPWEAPGNLGPGAWLLSAGALCAVIGAGVESSPELHRRLRRGDRNDVGAGFENGRAVVRDPARTDTEGDRHAVSTVWG